MKLRSNKAFIIILVTMSLAVLILSASVIVTIGCSELMATRVRNDLLVSAYYLAISGAELLYSDLKTKDTVVWDPSVSGSIAVGSTTIGTYSATATQTDTEEFCIVSEGTVSGHTATATVKYGYRADSVELTGPIPLGSAGPMSLTGASNPAKLKIEGPVFSGSDITESGNVNISNGAQPNVSLPEVSFWLGTEFDTNNDGDFAVDSDSDGVVTLAEAVDQDKETVFNADNVYTTGGSESSEITAKDAFYYYYTTYYTAAENNPTSESLNIGSGQSGFYSGAQSFDQGDISNDVPIIFVDGDVDITYNDQDWRGSDILNHTVVSTGTITIEQPTNRPGDTLTLISYGDFYSTGTMGNKGGTIGDIVVYSGGNIVIEDGGKMNASIYADGSLTINTIGDDQGKDHRVVNIMTTDWSSGDLPLGLPPGYPGSPGNTINLSTNFTIKNQSEYPPDWQRN